MKHIQSLPEPSADALHQSEKLIEEIRQEIKTHGGSIPFRRYMEMALYQPGLGYYVSGSHKIGEQGDFITAPEISPIFSQCIANQSAEILQKVGGCLLEFGAGIGTMASDILLELERSDCLPECYFIVEVSPDLIVRQQQTLEQNVPHLFDRVKWLSTLPENFNGVILANEVLDAMPVDVFTQQNDTVFKHHVVWQDHQLVEQLQIADERFSKKVELINIPQHALPYTSEINPAIKAWLSSLENSLDKGLILLIDYGYPKNEYYLAERNKGTLICHYQHLVNEAPLHYPGLQDITASVDFTAVAEAADELQLNIAGFTSQAIFLSNAGMENQYNRALDENPDLQYKLAQQIRTLTLPSEMGERFKVMALTKDYDEDLLGFAQLDQRYRL